MQKNPKLSLILAFQSQNNTGQRWQKFHKNMIFPLGSFKILLTWPINYGTKKNYWFHFMPFFLKNCLFSLSNFVNKPV